jgi:hypothetical protein
VNAGSGPSRISANGASRRPPAQSCQPVDVTRSTGRPPALGQDHAGGHRHGPRQRRSDPDGIQRLLRGEHQQTDADDPDESGDEQPWPWAHRGDGWILEDDYDAEFRSDRAPIGAVHGLVPERTIHIGSVAKTLAPSVRVGWLAVPQELLAPIVTTHETRVSQPATLEQLVLARLVENGRYDRHLRRVRRAYRERRDVLIEALAEAGLADCIEGIAAGMQAVLRLADGADDVAIVGELHQRGVEVVALSRYAVRSPARGLVIGFGQASPAQLRAAAAISAEVVGPRARRAAGGARSAGRPS